jgi:RNA polymerase-binding transcription factor DksA
VRVVSGISDPPADPAFDRDRDLGELIGLETDLAAVEVALRRLDDGSYWTCEVCRSPIPAAVAADPLVQRCEAHTAEASPDSF